jgi:hypothetical protein
MKANGLRTPRICVRAPYYFSKMPNRAKEESNGGDRRAVEVMSALLSVACPETNPACKVAAKFREIS